MYRENQVVVPAMFGIGSMIELKNLFTRLVGKITDPRLRISHVAALACGLGTE